MLELELVNFQRSAFNEKGFVLTGEPRHFAAESVDRVKYQWMSAKQNAPPPQYLQAPLTVTALRIKMAKFSPLEFSQFKYKHLL